MFGEFANSRYASELRRGVSTRPFSPQIEVEYRQAHLDRVQLRTRVWFSWSVLIGFELCAEYVHLHGLHRIYDAGLLFLLVIPAIVMFLIVWTRYYQGLFLKCTTPIAITFCSTIVVIANSIAAGHAEAATGLAVNVFAVHFLAGLPFRSAFLIDGAMLVVFAAAASLAHVPSPLLVYGLAVLAIATIVISFVQRDVEVSYRRGFLEHCLILEVASRDGLTGLINRRALDKRLQDIWRQALRDKHQIAVLLIDIDYFKKFNDEFGHQAGDAALRRVAHVIDGFARRPFDMAARYGGEEFAVILYDVAASWVPALCEQMRRSIEALNGPEPSNVALTVSIGAGILEPSIDRSIEGAIQFADEALYEAKQHGRNRVVIRGIDDYSQVQTGTFRWHWSLME